MEDQSLQIIIIIIALVIAISALGMLLYFIFRAYKKSRVINEDEDIHSASAHYNCPKCSQQMEKGYALAGRGIIYKKEDGEGISSFVTILSVLENTLSISLPPAVNRAWHCNTCKYLLLDHSALIRRKKKK